MPSLTDKRNAAAAALTHTIEGEALIVETESGDQLKRIEAASIRQIRLAVEMAGQGSQVVCRVTDDSDGETVFGSMAWRAPGSWDNNGRAFSELLTALHMMTAPFDADIRYLEGQSLTFVLTMFVLGALLAGVSVFFFVFLFLVEENAAGLALILPGILGGWLMRLFWPRGPKTYDPATYRQPPKSD